MGITRRSDSVELRPARIEDEEQFNLANYDLSESADEAGGDANSADARTSRSRKNKERRTERKLKKFLEQADPNTDGVRVKSNMGARKHRRVENVKILLSYTDRDDICMDYSDLVPRTITAFEHLLIEKENMKTWNEFIEKDEEDQRTILETGKWLSDDDEEKKEWFVVGGKSTPRKKTDDERKHHPAYSARACFEQLERRSKKLLSERHLPWGFVAYLENQLREFFNEDSNGVFIGRYECSLHRALAHAVAQFLRLSSKSITDESDSRITEIRNPRAFFIPPRLELVPYLSTLRREPIDYIAWVPETILEEEEEDSEGSSDTSFLEAGDM